MLSYTISRAALYIVVVALLAGTAVQTRAQEEESPFLYKCLGGVYSIATVVDDFIKRLLINDTLNANPAIDEARKRVPRSASSSELRPSFAK